MLPAAAYRDKSSCDFPNSHICHYSHLNSMAMGASALRRRGDRADSWCGMASRSTSDALSNVRFLTVAEVATAMRVSKMTVYRLVHAGDLPAVRVGRSFRVPEDAVNEYLRKAYFQTG
jgi:excisionase family DNA binding protein